MNKSSAVHQGAGRMVHHARVNADLPMSRFFRAEHDSWLKERVLNTAFVMAAVMLLLGLSLFNAHAADKKDAQANASSRTTRLPAVSGAWARATVPGQSVGAAYMKIDSPFNATLIGIESDVSRSAEVHTMRHQNGVMQMRKLTKLDIRAGQRMELAPGGAHLMLLGLKKPLKAGETLQLNMTFVDIAGAKTIVPVSVPIRPLGQ
jgi:copper(I)-binding protein